MPTPSYVLLPNWPMAWNGPSCCMYIRTSVCTAIDAGSVTSVSSAVVPCLGVVSDWYEHAPSALVPWGTSPSSSRSAPLAVGKDWRKEQCFSLYICSSWWLVSQEMWDRRWEGIHNTGRGAGSSTASIPFIQYNGVCAHLFVAPWYQILEVM